MKLQSKKMVARLLVVICICLSAIQGVSSSSDNVRAAGKLTREVEEVGKNIEITYLVDSCYGGGYTGRIRIRNIGAEPIFNWALKFQYKGNLTCIWNGDMISHKENWYIVRNAMYNSTIEPKESVEFGFQGIGELEKVNMDSCELVGEFKELSSSDYEINYKMKELWDNGAIVQVEIRNKGVDRIEGWKWECSQNGKIQSVWDAQQMGIKEGSILLGNKGNNGIIESGGIVNFEYLLSFDNYREPENQKLYYFDYLSQRDENEKTDEIPELKGSLVPIETKECEPSTSPTISISDEPAPTEDEEQDFDTDEDGLSDELEETYGTDKTKKDTDGDGLTDFEEIYIIGTDPLVDDTDGDRIADPDEDNDGDQLPNKLEIQYKTNPICADTDNDGLMDGEEVSVYLTNPLLQDTDKDGIMDGEEVALGLNPLLLDTDRDGIVDSEEKIPQRMETEIIVKEKPELTKIEISFAGTGVMERNTYIEATYGEDVMSSEVVGLVGSPVEINTACEFDMAEVVFSYDETLLGDTKEDNLGVLWYDEEHGEYVVMDSKVDKENHNVVMKTTHFSTYMLVDLLLWGAAIAKFPVYEFIDNYDLAFVCENSAYIEELVNGVVTSARAMAYNAKLGDNICEIEYGDTACVEFDFGREDELNFKEVNEDFDDALMFPAEWNDKENTGLGYRISAGLDLAIEKLSSTGKRNEKVILLYCSGEGMDDMDHSIDEAIKQGIKIYPVFFENRTYKDAIVEKASMTGGGCIDGTLYDLDEDEDLEKLVYKIWNTFPKVRSRVDKRSVDSDYDGVPDVFEEQGVLASNGKIIYTSPNNADTDGDGLSDGEELNLKVTEEGHYVAYLTSLPTLDDTDQDGLFDYEDPKPRTSNNIGAVININNKNGMLMRLQRWLVDLGYLNMGDTEYGLNYGALTRTAVNVYRLNHGFHNLIDAVDVNTYATIANDYFNLIGQNEISYKMECEKITTRRYVENVRIIKPKLMKYYLDKGVKVAWKDNSTIREKNGWKIEIYLYDYTEVVMKLLEKNEKMCDDLKDKNGIQQRLRFTKLVDNNGPWDIKRKEQWDKQMGVIWCSGKFPFVFQNQIINPEILGNITYGYWGTYIGFSEKELLLGGDFASFTSNLKGDSKADKQTIKKGVSLYYEVNKKK